MVTVQTEIFSGRPRVHEHGWQGNVEDNSRTDF